jgi:hypothetical protein
MNFDMAVRVSIGDKVFDGTLRDVLRINEATLTDEFVKQPSTYAYFAALAEFAVADVEQKKLAFSVLEANLDSQKRLEMRETKVSNAVSVGGWKEARAHPTRIWYKHVKSSGT